MVDMTTLGNVIKCARDMPKMSSADKDRFKDRTLDKWVCEAKKE